MVRLSLWLSDDDDVVADHKIVWQSAKRLLQMSLERHGPTHRATRVRAKEVRFQFRAYQRALKEFQRRRVYLVTKN